MLAMDEHVQMMNIEEKRVIAEPTKVLEDIPFVGKYMLCNGKLNGSTSFENDNMHYVNFRIYE